MPSPGPRCVICHKPRTWRCGECRAVMEAIAARNLAEYGLRMRHPTPPDHAARIARYARRASLGLPIFR
jgi:hypothetical protein